MLTESNPKYPMFKRASNPTITYSNLENKPDERHPLKDKFGMPPLGSNISERPQYTESKRSANDDSGRFGDKFMLNLPSKKSIRKNSSNVSSDIVNDLSIREFENKDHMNERYNSEIIQMECDMLDTKKSDPNETRHNYVGQKILPLSLSSPLNFQQSINFSTSFNRDLVVTNVDPSTPLAGVKKALYKHYYFDKVVTMSPSYRSYVFADKGDQFSEIPDLKERHSVEHSDSSLINFVTYMENTERENIPSTPREYDKPIEIRESIEPKQFYFTNVPKQSELSYFLSNETEHNIFVQTPFRLSNIQSDTKMDNFSNTNLFGNTTTVSKKTSDKSERNSFSRTPGRVSEFMISPGDRNRLVMQKRLEEVIELGKENESLESRKPKIRAKLKINPNTLSKIVGKDVSLSYKSNSILFHTDENEKEKEKVNHHEIEKDTERFDFDQFKDTGFNFHLKDSLESKHSLPTHHSNEIRFRPVKPHITNETLKNESNLIENGLNQSIAEKYKYSSLGTESTESRFRDHNQPLDDILSRLKTCLLEYNHEIIQNNIYFENPDLPLEYIEVAILKGEEILNNNTFMAKLDIDASGIKLAIDYFETLDPKFGLNNIVLSCLNELLEASFRKSKFLELHKSNTLKSTASSKKVTDSKFRVPRLNLDILSSDNSKSNKKTNILNNKPLNQAILKSLSSRDTGKNPIFNKHVKDWIAKRMSISDYERVKIKFTSFVLICKEELPSNHPGRRVLVNEIFEEMLVNGIPELDWFDFIQSKLNQEKIETGRSSGPICYGSRSNQECFF